MSERFAPKDTIWVCGACGKTAKDRYGIEGEHSRGWDESCALNAILCHEEKCFNDKGEYGWKAMKSYTPVISLMTSFPEDISKKAETLVSGIDADWSWDGQEFDYSAAQQDTVNAIAQALLDERERCAEIAETLAQQWDTYSAKAHEFSACMQISEAIRSPASPSKPAQGTPA